MTLVVDAGAVIAAADRRDPARTAVQRLLRDEPGPLVVPAPVTAEIDHLLGRRLGEQARRSFLADLAAARLLVPCLEPDDHRTVVELEARYADLAPGLADLSLVVVAARFATRRLATFDERHFRALRPLDGGAFTLLPTDEPDG